MPILRKLQSLANMKNKLYVNRPLLNGQDIRRWLRNQGVSSMLPINDLHTTICYSKTPVDWQQFAPDQSPITIQPQNCHLHKFGDAHVLIFDCSEFHDRWQQFRDGGASWDYPEYHPHLTLSYKPFDINAVQPYSGKLIYGGERFEPISDNWESDLKEIKV